MSSTPTQGAPDSLTSINFTGGFPTSKELAPSIIFIILYAITIPVLIWRLARRSDRTVILIRPSIFVTVRFASLVLRAVMSKSVYGEGELIAELVLISVGYLFLIEPLTSMWNRHVASAVATSERPKWVAKLAKALKVGLLAAIGTAVAGSSLISGALDNPSQLSTVKDLRYASSIITLAVIVISIIAIITTHIHFHLDARRSGYLILLAIPLLIISVYRIVQLFSKDPSEPVRSSAAFWILQIACEFVAYVLLLAISIPSWFPKETTEEAYNDVEMNNNKAQTPTA